MAHCADDESNVAALCARIARAAACASASASANGNTSSTTKSPTGSVNFCAARALRCSQRCCVDGRRRHDPNAHGNVKCVHELGVDFEPDHSAAHGQMTRDGCARGEEGGGERECWSFRKSRIALRERTIFDNLQQRLVRVCSAHTQITQQLDCGKGVKGGPVGLCEGRRRRPFRNPRPQHRAARTHPSVPRSA